MFECQTKGLAGLTKNMKLSVFMSGADDLRMHRLQSVKLEAKNLSKSIRNSTAPKISRIDQSGHSMLVNLCWSVATVL